ncbi:MAG: hypothetical protein LRY39_00310 [Alphaproteobacteria bacterium]|nr:hypothetical protein [Alphaproteobacteria bacterium]
MRNNNPSPNVIAFRARLKTPLKTLPKAEPLLPEEDESDVSLVRTFNPQGLTDTIDLGDDPDVQAARSAYEAAQAQLQKTMQRKAMLKLADGQQGVALLPENVEELCRQEPWKTGGSKDFSKSLLGFVPEKLAAAASRYPDGSEEHKRFTEASERAEQIYWDQMKVDLNHLCGKFHDNFSVSNKRALLEPLTANLYHMSRAMIGNPVWDGPGGRIAWMAHNLAPQYRKLYGNDGSGQRSGYNQYSLKANGNGAWDIETVEERSAAPAPAPL